MKSVENVPNFYQKDDVVEVIKEDEGVVVLPSVLAWENFEWTHEYFLKKPKQGFFLWIKKSLKKQLNTLIEISSKNVFQDLNNLIVIEKGAKVKLFSSCRSIKKSLGAKHFAKTNILIKENVELDFLQYNAWEKQDKFNTNYEYFLCKNAKADISVSNKGNGAEIVTKENIYLKEKGANAEIKIKMVAKNGGIFNSESYIYGEDDVRGHLDCSGIILDKKSRIKSIPGIICNSGKAVLTHEASIGKISEEKLMYLRMRGLSLKKAEELIIKSFLNS